MSKYHGKFGWYDLVTSDVEAAENFYGALMGWVFEPFPSANPNEPYHIVTKDGSPLGGVMPVPAEAKVNGMRPGWMGYLMVSDVHAYAEKIRQAGGKVYKGPSDIPGVGCFAVCTNLQGAVFLIFKGNKKEEELPPVAAMDAPGFCGWRELYAHDVDAALTFYADLFGWQKNEAIDMGPMGKYQTFRSQDGQPSGGIMNMLPQVPRPVWNFYFNVDDINVAAKCVADHGAMIVNGPMEVPGGRWVAQGFDPQGDFFALLGPRS